MIVNVQIMRGVAALMVFLAHLGVAHPGMGLDAVYPVYWWFGPSGVDIFFVISGFVVTSSAVKQGGVSTSAWSTASTFAAKRVFRIYPVYWAALAVAVMVSPPVKTATDGFPKHSLVEKIFLATPFNDYIMLAWSLCFEMWFYVILTGILALAPRRVFSALVVWAVLSLGFIVYGYVYRPDWSWVVPASPFQLEFMFGCLVAWLIRRRKETRLGWPVLIIGIAWYAASVYLNAKYGGYDPRWRAPLFGLASGFIIYGLIALELRKGVLLPRFMLPVGSASYSIYVWHQLTFFVLIYVSERLGLFGLLPSAVLLLAWAAVAVIIASASYRLIERPSMRWVERRMSQDQLPAIHAAAIGTG